MTLTNTQKFAKHIFRLLKVNEITFPIGRTNNGNLGITFNANNDEFEIMLDSVPLSTKNALQDENNIELKNMIEKYMFDSEHTVVFAKSSVGSMTEETAQKLSAEISQEQISHAKEAVMKKVTKHGKKTNS